MISAKEREIFLKYPDELTKSIQAVWDASRPLIPPTMDLPDVARFHIIVAAGYVANLVENLRLVGAVIENGENDLDGAIVTGFMRAYARFVDVSREKERAKENCDA